MKILKNWSKISFVDSDKKKSGKIGNINDSDHLAP